MLKIQFTISKEVKHFLINDGKMSCITPYFFSILLRYVSASCCDCAKSDDRYHDTIFQHFYIRRASTNLQCTYRLSSARHDSVLYRFVAFIQKPSVLSMQMLNPFLWIMDMIPNMMNSPRTITFQWWVIQQNLMESCHLNSGLHLCTNR